MTLSEAKAIWGVSARAALTGTNTSGTARVGVDGGAQSFPDADVAYAVTVAPNAAGDVATLTMRTGVVAQTTGTPTITDGDGKDLEGVTLPTMVTLYAVLVEIDGGNGDVLVAVLDQNALEVPSSAHSFVEAKIFRGGEALATYSAESVVVTFSDGVAGDTVKVTVIGKSS